MIWRLILVFAAFMPAIVLLWYGMAKGRSDWRNEALWSAFLTGAVATLGAGAVGYGLQALFDPLHVPPVMSAGAKALFAAAIPEESAKFLVLLCIALKHVDVRREQDTIVLALAVSLGFAALENFFYVASAEKSVSVALMRAVTAVPGHGIDGLAMGALLTLARLRNDRFVFWAALAVPIGLHAAYDFPLMLSSADKAYWAIWGWCWIVILGASSAFVIVMCNRTWPLAAAFDAGTKRDGDAAISNTRVAASGFAVIMVGLLLASGVYLVARTDHLWWFAAISVIPVCFGVDLLLTGLVSHSRLSRIHAPS